MRIHLFATVFIYFLLNACTKKDICEPPSFAAPAEETNSLRTLLDNAGIVYTEDSRGFFYEITRQTEELKPNLCSSVRVGYELRLMNGNLVESTPGVVFGLNSLIKGWQQGIPLIGAGGSIILYLPPSLAYGNRASGSIPANSNLIFKIDLLEVF